MVGWRDGDKHPVLSLTVMLVVVKIASFALLTSILCSVTFISPLVYSLVYAAGQALAAVVIAWFISSIIDEIYSNVWGRKFSPRDGKCVLITGCDTGFGHVTALHLNEVGYTVFAGCLRGDGDGANRLRQQCKHPEKMHVLSFDVCSDKDISSVYQVIENHTETTGEKMHALINNAGIAFWGPLEWGSFEQDVTPVVNVDMAAVLKVSLKFIPLLRRTQESRIIYMTSFITHQSIPYLAPYAMAKFGVKSFADGLRQEVASRPDYYRDMKVLVVMPTVFKTGLTAYDSVLQTIESKWQRTSAPVKRAYGDYLYTGFCTFIRLCRFFEFLDFVAIRSDLKEVAVAFDHVMRVSDPDEATEMISWYSRPSYYLSRTVIPDEVMELFFSIEAPLINLFSLLFSKLMSYT